jgi:hypothetical protein
MSLMNSSRSQKDLMLHMLRKQQNRYMAQESSLGDTKPNSTLLQSLDQDSVNTSVMAKNNSHFQSALKMPVESLLVSHRSNQRDSIGIKDIRNYDSMFEMGTNSLLSSTQNIPKKDAEVERAKIDKALKNLDKREIELWNA